MFCGQSRQRRFATGEFNNGRALYGLSIAPEELLDKANVEVTRRATATDGVLDYYLHTPGGLVTVSGGGFGEQRIQSLSIPGSDQDYFNDMVRRLDSIIDLDFRQVNDSLSADVDLYYDTEIDLGGGGNILGLATTSGSDSWELYVNYSAVENDEPYRRYLLIHEFGHSLGLEHPFEASDGDVLNGNTDPWSSAYPEDTVMAYRSPSSGSWPDFFSNNDLNALIEVWGAERQYLGDGNDLYIGNPYKDDVVGGTGADIITGEVGFDLIAGGAGDDELRGGRNADEVRGGAGNDRLFGGRGHDTLIGGKGNDIIRGGYGKDIFQLSPGNDIIQDFSFSDDDQLFVSRSITFTLGQDQDDLVIKTQFGNTRLINVSLNEFDVSRFILLV